MEYIGSGHLKTYFTVADGWVVYGKRLKKLKIKDLKKMKEKNCVYLDTIDVELKKFLGMSVILKTYALFHPYRIEKFLTYMLLRLICTRVIRLHIPCIVDSSSWQQQEKEEVGIKIIGFTYEQIAILINQIRKNKDYLNDKVKKVRSKEIIEFAIINNINPKVINVKSNSLGVIFCHECIK